MEEDLNLLPQLPLEVWSEIILFCDSLKDRMNLSFTCKALRCLVDEKPRWKQLFKATTRKISVVPSDCTNWAEACKIKREYENLTEAIPNCSDGDRIYLPPGVYDISEPISPLARLRFNRLKICGLYEREIGPNGIGSVTFGPDTYQPPEPRRESEESEAVTLPPADNNNPNSSEEPPPKPIPEYPKLLRTTRIMGSAVPFISSQTTVTDLTIKDIEFVLNDDKESHGIGIIGIGHSGELKIKRCGFIKAFPILVYRSAHLNIRFCHFHNRRTGISIYSSAPNIMILLLATGVIRRNDSTGENAYHEASVEKCVIEQCTGYGVSLVAARPAKPKKEDAPDDPSSTAAENSNAEGPAAEAEEPEDLNTDPLMTGRVSQCRIRECEHSGISVDGLVKVECSENEVAKCFHGMTFKGPCQASVSSNRVVENRYEPLFSVQGKEKVKLVRNYLASSVGPCLGGWPIVFELEGSANVLEERKGVDQVCRDAIRNKMCTVVNTGSEFYSQFWWNCDTCGWGVDAGLCVTCRKTCHKGHKLSQHQKVVYVRGEEEGKREDGEEEDPPLANFGLFYCDCGSKGLGVCRCLGIL